MVVVNLNYFISERNFPYCQFSGLLLFGSTVYATETVCCLDYNCHKGDNCKKKPSCGKIYGNVICNEKLVLKGIATIAKNNFVFENG